MTIGEKIREYRLLRKLTQKSLGELTGIGEATIRKYELGIRNPKPTQIKKIAKAFGISEHYFYDIEMNNLNISTIGDVMALLISIDSATSIKCDGDNQTISFSFEDNRINELLQKWIDEKKQYKSFRDNLGFEEELMPNHEFEIAENTDRVLMEELKRRFSSDATLLKSDTTK